MDIIDCIDDYYIDGINDIKVIYSFNNDNEIDNDDINSINDINDKNDVKNINENDHDCSFIQSQYSMAVYESPP